MTTEAVNHSGSTPIQQERVPPLNPTRLKVAGVVLAFLMMGAAVICHFLHVNALAVYIPGSLGGALIIGIAIWTAIDCINQAKEKSQNQEYEKMQEELSWLDKAWQGQTEEIAKGIAEKRVTADLNVLLKCAAENGHLETVELLLKEGVDPTQDNNGSYTALHKAFLPNSGKTLDRIYAITQALLEKFPTLVNINGGVLANLILSPLHLACMGFDLIDTKNDKHTDADLVQLLLDYKADVNALDERQNTPLHNVASGGLFGSIPPDLGVIKVLVKGGADLNAKNKEGKTAIQIAQKNFPDWFQANIAEFNKILAHQKS